MTLSVGFIIESEGDDNIAEGVLADAIGYPKIHKNTQIPCKKCECFTAFKYNQTKVSIPIYEGESEISEQNTLLAVLALDGLEREKDGGYHKIEIEFDINECHGLIINVRDLKNPKNFVTMEIGNYWDKYDQQQIDFFIAIEASLKMDDKEQEINEKAKNDLEVFVNEYCDKLQDFMKMINENKECVMEWIDSNPNLDAKYYIDKQQTFKQLVIEKLNQTIQFEIDDKK